MSLGREHDVTFFGYGKQWKVEDEIVKGQRYCSQNHFIFVPAQFFTIVTL